MSTPDAQELTARARVELLTGRTVAVLGFGSQGQAHAENLRDSGIRVVVAQRAGARRESAVAAGFQPVEISAAVTEADLLIFGLPDETAPGIYAREIEPVLRAGQTLGFIHGFNIRYGQIAAPPTVDVVLVAPKGQGRGVRSEYVAGRGVPALLAVAQDATGRAWDTALGWAAGIGAHRAGLLATTFREETETDLFGEQAVLCGGLTALIKAAFETLVAAGYAPEVAYFECCHELKLIVDLIYEGGITAMRERTSNTARFGDLTRGPRVLGDGVSDRLRAILAEIQSGQFAQEWLAEAASGKANFRAWTERDREHLLEETGRRLRERMWGRKP